MERGLGLVLLMLSAVAPAMGAGWEAPGSDSAPIQEQHSPTGSAGPERGDEAEPASTSEGPSDASGSPGETRGPFSYRIEGVVDSIVHYEELREKEREWSLNTTRGTFRFHGTFQDWLDFKIGLVGRGHFGTKDVDYVPFMPWHVRNDFIPDDPATGLPGTGAYLRAEVAGDFYLQEAYGHLKAGPVYFRLGRQKIETGVGYSYAPTDLLNRKNPLDPTFEIDGFDAAKVGVRLSSRSEVQALVVLRDMPTYLGRFETRAENWKAALQLTSVARRRVNWNYINTAEGLNWLHQGGQVGDFERNFRWNQVSGEFKRTIGGTSIYGEAGIAFIEDLRHSSIPIPQEFQATHERFLVGVDSTFPSRLRVILEYMRQGDGRAYGDPIDLNDMMAFNFGETLAADQDSFYGECSYPISKRVEFTYKNLAVLDHAAVMVNPWIHFDPRQNLRLSFSVYQFFGADGSSYEDIGMGGYAQLKLRF